MTLNFTKQTNKDYNELLNLLENKFTEKGFRVLHIHDVSNNLKEKGFPFEDYSIVEVCNAAFAHKVLSESKEAGSIMPCKILVYKDGGNTFVSFPLPTKLIETLGMQDFIEIAKEIEDIFINIIEEVA